MATGLLDQLRQSRRRVRSSHAFTRIQWLQYVVLVTIWCAANINFWYFWLRVPHVDTPALFWVMTVAFFYETTVLPSMYLFFLGRMRIPHDVPAPPGLSVAVVTLCVPSKESIAIIKRQIRSMAAVRYPHDNWLLDEEDHPDVAALCEQFGVKHFSRKGIERWNQPGPPFQAKTKAGNVNAWLYEHGRKYDFFVQLDIDHNPTPDYLDRVLGHFTDPSVAWVQAPSVYGNLHSWTARGSAEQELVLQGPLQMGFYGFSETPFIIGSHSTYRTAAMLEIGGMQPTRAEDHLDTVVLAQHDYRGVFVPDVIAIGEGPEEFDTYLAQQFAWAFSMIQVLFHYAIRYARNYRPRTALQFLFVQTWYICWSGSMLVLFFLPAWMLATHTQMAQIALGPFLLYYFPLPLTAIGIWWWSRTWFSPRGLRLSWRGIILHIARWPVVLWALINVVFRIKRPYMITPKGILRGASRPFNLSAQGPYLVLILSSLGSCWWSMLRWQHDPTQGYLLFALQGAAFMLLVFWVALVQDVLAVVRDRISWLRALVLRWRPLLVGLALSLALLWTSMAASPQIFAAVTWVNAPPALVNAQAPYASPIPVPTQAAVLPQAIPSPTSLPLPPLVAPDFVAMARQGRFYGAYDPQARLLDPSFGVEMIYTNLSAQALAALPGQLRSIGERGQVPLVTIEPWPLDPSGGQEADVLENLITGVYDAQLLQIATALDAYPGQVVLRPMHEMEIIGLYPWSLGEPNEYIAAYRHIHMLLTGESSDKRIWVWSPAGNENMLAYYPGDDVVDYVGFTLLGRQVVTPAAGPGSSLTFRQLMDEKYARARSLGKPVIIAELGVSGTLEAQTSWLHDMFVELPEYPDVRGIICYNAPNATNAFVPQPPDYTITNVQWRAAQEASVER